MAPGARCACSSACRAEACSCSCLLISSRQRHAKTLPVKNGIIALPKTEFSACYTSLGDMINWTSPDVAGAVAAFLTPFAVIIWKRLSPVSSFSEFDFISRDELKRRNNWIDRVATLLMFVGLMSFVFPYAQGTPLIDPIGGALGLGLMMWLPASFVMVVTLPHGTTRFREFLR